MHNNESIKAAALLDTWTEAPWDNGVQLESLADMAKVAVRTWNSLYEIVVIDGPRGEILVRGGRRFPELTPARLIGATLGGSFCKLRGIYPGFRMELTVDGECTLTSPVAAIEVLAES